MGPPAANGGSQVYGTDLDGPYAANILNESKGIALRSPVIDLAGDTFVTLDFAYYLDLSAEEEGGGRVNILNEQGELIEALNPLLIVNFVTEREWTKFGPTRLSQAVTEAGKIIVEFEFLSTVGGGENAGGLYIDDLVVK